MRKTIRPWTAAQWVVATALAALLVGAALIGVYFGLRHWERRETIKDAREMLRSRPGTIEQAPQGNPRVTAASYRHIRLGMAYSDVVELLGEPGAVLAQTDSPVPGHEPREVVRYWIGPAGVIALRFVNNAVYAKAQEGLE